MGWGELQEECTEVGPLRELTLNRGSATVGAESKEEFTSNIFELDSRRVLVRRSPHGQQVVVPVGMRALIMELFHE